MIQNYSIIFRGEIRPNVFLFDIALVDEELSATTVVGSAVVNMASYQDGKIFLSNPKKLDAYSKQLAEECVSQARQIMKVIQPDI